MQEAAAATNDKKERIAREDLLRANTYALLAQLLRSEPDEEFLRELSILSGDDSEFGRALSVLAAAARATNAESVADEFQVLFIGVGDSELKPYGSYYLTGFMYEKPLARLRSALADLGLAKSENTAEPEDHIAALCEAMCALITGEFGPAATVAEQRDFFDAHIRPWAGLFFRDLEEAESAEFFRPVGTIGRLFTRIEAQAFEMDA